jgi:hypothetical protein
LTDKDLYKSVETRVKNTVREPAFEREVYRLLLDKEIKVNQKIFFNQNYKDLLI